MITYSNHISLVNKILFMQKNEEHFVNVEKLEGDLLSQQWEENNYVVSPHK